MDTDRTLQMVRQGYPWASGVRAGAVSAPTRLAGRRAVVVGGPEGVRRFYDASLRRRGAFPPPVKLVLFGPGTVHGLDDAEHHARKALFVDLLDARSISSLAAQAQQEWDTVLADGRDRLVVFDEAVRVQGRAVLRWAGVPEPEGHDRYASLMAAVVDGFAKPGPAYVRAVAARLRLTAWSQGLVRRVRASQVAAAPDTVLQAVAGATDRRGRPLPVNVAATELLNVLRPTVAVSWFIAFAAAALHEQPQWRGRIADGDEVAVRAFAQEVRRYYPFTPLLVALARSGQDVLGVRVPRWGLVVLDVWGTLHDPAHWDEAHAFRPERFLDDDVDLDLLVPQGGGSVRTGHRCPGEDVVLATLSVAVRALAGLPHELPPQDLGYDVTEVITRPRSGVVLQRAGTS